jgi:hypothetical protein
MCAPDSRPIIQQTGISGGNNYENENYGGNQRSGFLFNDDDGWRGVV